MFKKEIEVLRAKYAHVGFVKLTNKTSLFSKDNYYPFASSIWVVQLDCLVVRKTGSFLWLY